MKRVGPGNLTSEDRRQLQMLCAEQRHPFSWSSRVRLTDRDLGRFPDNTLFHRLAREVCHTGCLPRKELFEAWETARRTRRLFRGGRVIDFAGGHGLLAHAMVILDDASPEALVVDTVHPPSSARLHTALAVRWPRLSARIRPVSVPLETIDIGPGDVVVSVHACGALTDRVLDYASARRARVAVLPCCHDLDAGDGGGLDGWLDGSLAIDVVRATRLRERGYRVWTQSIPAAITPKNRLLLAAPL